jgi:hypothetical protein
MRYEIKNATAPGDMLALMEKQMRAIARSLHKPLSA